MAAAAGHDDGSDFDDSISCAVRRLQGEVSPSQANDSHSHRAMAPFSARRSSAVQTPTTPRSLLFPKGVSSRASATAAPYTPDAMKDSSWAQPQSLPQRLSISLDHVSAAALSSDEGGDVDSDYAHHHDVANPDDVDSALDFELSSSAASWTPAAVRQNSDSSPRTSGARLEDSYAASTLYALYDNSRRGSVSTSLLEAPSIIRLRLDWQVAGSTPRVNTSSVQGLSDPSQVTSPRDAGVEGGERSALDALTMLSGGSDDFPERSSRCVYEIVWNPVADRERTTATAPDMPVSLNQISSAPHVTAGTGSHLGSLSVLPTGAAVVPSSAVTVPHAVLTVLAQHARTLQQPAVLNPLMKPFFGGLPSLAGSAGLSHAQPTNRTALTSPGHSATGPVSITAAAPSLHGAA